MNLSTTTSTQNDYPEVRKMNVTSSISGSFEYASPTPYKCIFRVQNGKIIPIGRADMPRCEVADEILEKNIYHNSELELEAFLRGEL